MSSEQKPPVKITPLFGRSQAISAIRKAYEDAKSGVQRFVLIEGESGVGKTALGEDLRATVLADSGVFIHVRSQNDLRDAPYQALANGIHEYFDNEVIKNPVLDSGLRVRLTKALGTNSGAVARLIPALPKIIGRHEERSVLRATEQRDRLNTALQSVITSLSSQQRPVVLFVDDLQWADSPCRQLLIQLLTSVRMPGILVIAALRTSELVATHPAKRWLTDVAQARVRYSRVAVGNLALDDVKSYLADRLGRVYPYSDELADVIFTKTYGNPYFIDQFYGFLIQAGALRGRNGSWIYDPTVARELSPTANVFEVIVNRVKSLGQQAKAILGLASCLGGKFSLDDLLLVSRWARKGLDEALKESYDAGLISFSQLGQYSFAHERIHEAIYKMLDARERGLNHYKIATALHQASDGSSLASQAPMLARHYRAGMEYVDTVDEKLKVAGINLAAARAARAGQNWKEVSSFIESALEALPELNWKAYDDLLYQIYLIKAEAASYLGDQNASVEIFDFLLRNVKDAGRIAEIYGLMVDIQLALGQYRRAAEVGLQGLRALGMRLPSHAASTGMALEAVNFFLLKRVEKQIRSGGPELLESLPVGTGKPWDRLLVLMILVAYFNRDQMLINLALRASLRTLNEGVFEGSWCALSFSIGLVGNRDEDKQALSAVSEFCLKAARKTASLDGAVTSLLVSASQFAGVKSVRTVAQDLNSCFENSKGCGSTSVPMSAALLAGSWGLFSGQPLLSVDMALESYLFFMKEHRSQAHLDSLSCSLVAVNALKGESSSAGSFSLSDLSEDEMVKRLRAQPTAFPFAWYGLRRIWVDYMLGFFERGVRNLEKVSESTKSLPFTSDRLLFAAYSALLLAAVIPNAGIFKQFRYKTMIRARMKYLRNSGDRQGQLLYLLAQGEYDRVCRRNASASLHFKKAIETARDLRIVYLEALGEELLGRHEALLPERGNAIQHLRKAAELYADWGAMAKVEQLEMQARMVVPNRSHPSENEESVLVGRAA